MRLDMSHVIVDRPRRGGGRTRRGRALAHDDLPSHEGIRRPHCDDRKSFNEHLNPLKRFLHSQVGRPWDAVYSEICANLRPDSTVHQHVRDHVDDFVARKPGRPAQYRRFFRDDRPWREPLYVDPTDGILKRTEDLPEVKAARRAAREKPEPAPERLSLGPDAELRRIGGLWYEIRLAAMPEPDYVDGQLATPPVRDAVSHVRIPAGPLHDQPSTWRTYRWTYPDRRYAITKRRLSRAELRQHRLTDQPPVV